MKWGTLLAKLVTAGLMAARQTTTPAAPAAARRLPTVTRDMIEPRNKALDRYDMAEAYRAFCIAHFHTEDERELAEDYAEVIYSYTGHIEELERERIHTHKRIRLAMRALSANSEGIFEPKDGGEWDFSYLHDADTIRETIARRKARLEAQDAELAALKADARDFFVEFLNEKIRDYNSRLR